jgi:Ca-activated chloride channel homolog
VLGFGMGNLKDERMEQLADKGNGNYAYIDDVMEARKTFVHEMGATLVTVAKDVKLQIEFNPAEVQAYRLIGYENRLLEAEEFDDDRKDAGEMGAGHSVTALYEVVPSNARLDVEVSSGAPKRYQRTPSLSRESMSGELLHVNVRYKHPSDSTSRLMQVAVRDRDASLTDDFRFALAVAGYGMLLRDSPHKGRWTYDDVLEMASGAVGDDDDGYRREFVAMVKATRELAGRVASRRP